VKVKFKTIDEANTAYAVAINTEQRIAALRALSLAVDMEIERLIPRAPDWSCNGCRMTWAGGTAPEDLKCPDCGEPLEEDK
jgi:rubrerythrin